MKKKLTLHRETLQRLDNSTLKDANGGSDVSCDCQKTFDCPRPTVVDCGHTEGC